MKNLSNMNFNIFNLIIIFAVVHGIVFSSIILFSKKYSTKTHQFLALIILIISLSNLDYWFRDTRISSLWEYYSLTYVPFDLLILPFYYYFVISYLNIKKKYAKYLFVPFLVRYSAQILSIIYSLFLVDYFKFPARLLKYLLKVDEYGTISFILFLVFALFRTIYQFESQQEVDHRFVKKETNWLKRPLKYAIGLCLFWLFVTLFDDLIPNVLSWTQKYYFIWLSLSFLIYWLGYLGIRQIGIFNQRQQIRDDFVAIIPQSSKKPTRGIVNVDRFEKIDNCIRDERLYTNSLISLNSLAEKFGLSEGYLSQLINSHTKGNFSSYINNLRIEEAKQLLINENYKDYTIITIAFESGFNSKSAFYNAFKNNTGMSPSRFRTQY